MRLAIITGADSVYFDLMHDLLATLSLAKVDLDHELCVLDLGLTSDQIAITEGFGATVVRPDWVFDVPEALRTSANLGYGARPVLPEYFPGHDMYLWLDADISVQDGQFLSAFVASASDGHLAIAEEVDRSYRLEAYALKWQLGNAFRCFGLWGGLKLSLGRPINAGVFALSAEAPHWRIWRERYQQAVKRAGRVNLDQHALMAALYLDHLPCRYLDSTHNWICARSQPLWDETNLAFCRPYAPFDKIHVLHLAGRHKNKLWDIETRGGAIEPMRLSLCQAPAPTS